MNDFAKFNEIYGRYFRMRPPPGETVQVAKLSPAMRHRDLVICGK